MSREDPLDEDVSTDLTTTEADAVGAEPEVVEGAGRPASTVPPTTDATVAGGSPVQDEVNS
jgi:hypothetical protein